MKKKVLIILDSYKYSKKEDAIRDKIASLCRPSFFYTDYENRTITFFHGLKFVGNFLSHVTYWAISFFLALKLFVSKQRAEITIFINPIVGFFYCLLLSLLHRDENVCLAGFIFEEKNSSLYLALRKRFVKFAYRKVSHLIVYSSEEVDKYSAIFPSLADKITFSRYGRDFNIFGENEYHTTEKYVASGGASNRNFDTLVEAMSILEKKDPQILCRIATRPSAFSIKHQLENLEVLTDIRMATFGSFLERSSFVIIPILDNSISAGHMALLEAMYRQKVVIATDLAAIRDYADEEQVYLYRANDSRELAEIIEHVYANIDSDEVQDKALAAKTKYDEEYTFNQFVYRLVEKCIRLNNRDSNEE